MKGNGLDKVGRSRSRKKAQTPDQRAQANKQNAVRVQRHRDKTALETARFVAGQACSVLIRLDATDSQYLGEAMRIRALWAPKNYDLDEYIQTLIVRDRDELHRQLAAMPPCQKCGLNLPASCERLHHGESDCVLTHGARSLRL